MAPDSLASYSGGDTVALTTFLGHVGTRRIILWAPSRPKAPTDQLVPLHANVEGTTTAGPRSQLWDFGDLGVVLDHDTASACLDAPPSLVLVIEAVNLQGQSRVAAASTQQAVGAGADDDGVLVTT